MHRILLVTENPDFKNCTSSAHGVRMRVAGDMSVRELRDRFGHFAACVNGQRVLFSKDACVRDVVAYDEELSIFVSPGKG